MLHSSPGRSGYDVNACTKRDFDGKVKVKLKVSRSDRMIAVVTILPHGSLRVRTKRGQESQHKPVCNPSFETRTPLLPHISHPTCCYGYLYICRPTCCTLETTS